MCKIITKTSNFLHKHLFTQICNLDVDFPKTRRSTTTNNEQAQWDARVAIRTNIKLYIHLFMSQKDIFQERNISLGDK